MPTMQHIAKEGRIFVIGVTSCQRGADVPADIPGHNDLYDDDEWLSRGNSCIVGPDGDLLAGPLVGETGIVLAELDLGRISRARRQFDPVGHYSRPDVFHLQVDRRYRPVVTTVGAEGEASSSPAANETPDAVRSSTAAF